MRVQKIVCTRYLFKFQDIVGCKEQEVLMGLLEKKENLETLVVLDLMANPVDAK